jgi:hypothetical protein
VSKKKEKERDKSKKNKQGKANKTSEQPVSGMAVAGCYTDGTPLDRVQDLEAKLILNPARFTSVQAFRDSARWYSEQPRRSGLVSSRTVRQG